MSKSCFVLLLAIFCSAAGHAQGGSGGVVDYSNAQQFMNDGNGRPLLLHTEYLVEGSPFYTDQYCSAAIKVRGGRRYNNMRVKVNLENNAVIYDLGKSEMEAITPIERIDFENCEDPSKNRTLMNGFPDIDEQNSLNYYVVLDSGKNMLLKFIRVSYRENKPYGSASVTRYYDQKNLYYSYNKMSGMRRIRDKESLIGALSDRNKQVTQFIAGRKINCRSEKGMEEVFAYYNTLD